MTSWKVLKGLPARAGGGRDCNPTFATMSGWVIRVASDLESAPRTATSVSEGLTSFRIFHLRKASDGLRDNLPGKMTSLRREYAPYVIEGLATRTREARKPRHKPVHPSSLLMTSLPVSKMPLFSPLGCVCCLVVMTATGIVKS